ncbi:MAG: hemerythrin family protein [Proteobacteria bacterium]|nr:hemerythrin family protein [Pseudomonadota bacterium]
MQSEPAIFDRVEMCLVGHPAIDDAHREFDLLLQSMVAAEEAGLGAALDAMLNHAEAHFALEEELMARHDFPARECHAAEHGRVLASIREVSALLREGDADVVRELAQALADWFPGHSDYMDASVANWITKKTAGGAPIVLRRPAARLAPTAQHPTTERLDCVTVALESP